MSDEETPSPPAPAAEAPQAAAPSEDWEGRFKYLLADFENFRRRTARQQDQTRESARAELLRGLLPILEAFERARDAVDQLPPKDPVRRGLELLGKEWRAFLDTEGVQPLARPGMAFNPDDHEAIAEAPVTAEHRPGQVVEVVQQGYAFAGGLLRPAKVVVARTAATATTPARSEPAEEPPADSSE